MPGVTKSPFLMVKRSRNAPSYLRRLLILDRVSCYALFWESFRVRRVFHMNRIDQYKNLLVFRCITNAAASLRFESRTDVVVVQSRSSAARVLGVERADTAWSSHTTYGTDHASLAVFRTTCGRYLVVSLSDDQRQMRAVAEEVGITASLDLHKAYREADMSGTLSSNRSRDLIEVNEHDAMTIVLDDGAEKHLRCSFGRSCFRVLGR